MEYVRIEEETRRGNVANMIILAAGQLLSELEPRMFEVFTLN